MDGTEDGVVRRGPRVWLRIDGLVLLVGSLALFATTDQPWWLVPLVILVPDVSALGYLADTRIGAAVYNAGHTYVLPALLSAAGLLADDDLVLALGLIWFAHVGMDRACGFGLKYGDAFRHTHLGWLGGRRDAPRTAPS